MSDHRLTGYRTTFHRMFGEQGDDTPRVDKVEIPLIQRDYAQGRETPRVNAIRGNFLDALYGALADHSTVGLDFIYGEVDDGTFEPLDGQQRLTTLFLLHWYFAFRLDDLGSAHPWTSFTYATRPSARLFCERIVKNPPPPDFAGPPSAWITDQSWYLHLWRFDPTIRSMLVTIDAIAARFGAEDPEVMWSRLVDDESPAIWFQLLPIDEMGAAEDLYIKMNSRGKPLTQFEAFKAHLGPLVAEASVDEELGHKIDGAWTDLFWPYRGENDIVDDEFMRYFDFLIEVCEWSEGTVRGEHILTPEQRIDALARSSDGPQHLKFICAAFDVWVGDTTIADVFAEMFRTPSEGAGLRLFGAPTTNLFQSCCERYGETRGANRLFSLTDTLLLFAVLVHMMDDTDDAARRLRQLRNVNEASQFEMRVQNMPKLVREVSSFMRSGDLDSLSSFNQNQVVDEVLKRGLRDRQPDLTPTLDRLEDHTILRGTLAAFELDSTIETRTEAFEVAFEQSNWPLLTGALLATGEYQRDYPDSDFHRFGSRTTEGVWRTGLVDRGDRGALMRLRTVLGDLLDRVAEASSDAPSALEVVMAEFLSERVASSHYDWRYYLVRYETMREGNSGIYYGANGRLGYEMTMLRKTVQRSFYRDPYLYAIWDEACQPVEVDDPWFYGYSTAPRWMNLVRSGTGLRSVHAGITVRAPTDPQKHETLRSLCEAMNMTPAADGWTLEVEQDDRDGLLVDTSDRVALGAGLLADLIKAGL